MGEMKVVDVDFSYKIATEQDFETLAEIRIRAMRNSLEHLMRFDPHRARSRLRDSFQPTNTKILLVDGKPVGFVAVEHQRCWI